MLVRGHNGVGGGWYARDFYLMADTGSSAPAGAPTSTPMPPMPPTGTLPTPVAIQGVPCTVTIKGVATSGTCTGTFTPAK
jgi:hypothetical protein